MQPVGKDIWLQQPVPAHHRVYAAGCTVWDPFVVRINAWGKRRRHRRCIGQSLLPSSSPCGKPHRLKQPRGSLSGWNSQAAMCGKPAATANRHLHRICVCMHQPSANASVDRLKQLHSGVSVCMYDRLEQPDRIHEQIYDIFATSSRGVSNNHVVNTT